MLLYQPNIQPRFKVICEDPPPLLWIIVYVYLLKERKYVFPPERTDPQWFVEVYKSADILRPVRLWHQKQLFDCDWGKAPEKNNQRDYKDRSVISLSSTQYLT